MTPEQLQEIQEFCINEGYEITDFKPEVPLIVVAKDAVSYRIEYTALQNLYEYIQYQKKHPVPKERYIIGHTEEGEMTVRANPHF